MKNNGRKIVYVSSNIWDVQRHLLESLNNAGTNADVLTYTLRRDKKNSMQSDVSCHVESNSILRGPLFFITRLKKIAKKFSQEYDFGTTAVLHANMFFEDGYICRYISNHKRIPYIVSVRNTDMNLWFLWKLPWIKRAGIRNLVESDAIICLSKVYRDKLILRVPENYKDIIEKKIHIVPNGIDDFWLENLYFGQRIIEGCIRFITVGRIEENKNQLRTAQAIKKFREKSGLDVKYTLVGACKDEHILKQLKKFDFVEIKPHMTKENLIHEYRKNDIFIMPSHSETFGLVYVEAMTQGLPVIYTSGQGFDKQFEDGTVGMPVDDAIIDDIVIGIEAIIEKYSVIAQNVVRLSKYYNWKRIAATLVSIYTDCINHTEFGDEFGTDH